MDAETGERNRDNETGELLPCVEDCNSETGETEFVEYVVQNKRTFKIPKKYMQSSKSIPHKYENKQDMSPALMFLLPTLFFYPAITSIIIAILEVIIHTWAHRKNKQITDKNVYYKSPMHIIASEFCAKCRDAKSMDKIERMQEKRALRFRCNYEYVKRIVT